MVCIKPLPTRHKSSLDPRAEAILLWAQWQLWSRGREVPDDVSNERNGNQKWGDSQVARVVKGREKER